LPQSTEPTVRATTDRHHRSATTRKETVDGDGRDSAMPASVGQEGAPRRVVRLRSPFGRGSPRQPAGEGQHDLLKHGVDITADEGTPAGDLRDLLERVGVGFGAHGYREDGRRLVRPGGLLELGDQ